MPEFVSIDSVKPASYNPRRIDEKEFSELCESLRVLGVIVPVIVNPANNVLVAGHQRTKAAKAIGLTELPCFYASNVSPSDEVLFNQIHNGTDYDKGIVGVMEAFEEPGWQQCPPERNQCNCERSGIVGEVVKLIQRYGNVLSCVAAMNGDVFSSAAYATACRKLNIPANVYVIEPEKEDFARKAFKASYGVFSYEHLQKNTWVQGLAQMHRHRDKRNDKGTKTKPRSCKSRLYENLVLPYVTKDMRILDFGCGKGLYIDMLAKEGFKAFGLEWYNNNGSAINIDPTWPTA